MKNETLNLVIKWSEQTGWYCYDSYTYDGAPDARQDQHVIGYGDTPKEAVNHWFYYMEPFKTME